MFTKKKRLFRAVLVALVLLLLVIRKTKRLTEVKVVLPPHYHSDENPLKSSSHTTPAWRQSCTKERTNFVYIKVPKTGSSTISAMFRRYGFKRQLSFVLPVGDRIYLGWPYPLVPGMFRPNKTLTYNILCEHSVYNDEFFQSLMPPDTIFTASLREPFSRFKSAFFFFKVAKYAGIRSNDPIKTFFEDPNKFDSLYMATNDRTCIPAGVSMLRNAQAFNFGFPLGFNDRDQTNNSTFVSTWLTSIKKRFKFVIITEHLHESLILWRRMMCWTMKDILYHTRSVQHYKSKNGSPSELEFAKFYRQWSSIDVQLYDHYNRTLWQYIAEEGPDFWSELDQFNRVMHNVTAFCGYRRLDTNLIIRQSTWNEEFIYARSDCALLKNNLLSELKDQYNKIKKNVPTRNPVGNNC